MFLYREWQVGRRCHQFVLMIPWQLDCNGWIEGTEISKGNLKNHRLHMIEYILILITSLSGFTVAIMTIINIIIKRSWTNERYS